MSLPAAYKAVDRARGFTLIELIMVVAILVILLATSSSLMSRFFVSAQREDLTTQLTQSLRQARSNASSRRGASEYGVYITSSTFTLYRGSNYASRNQTYDLMTTVEPSMTLFTSYPGNDIQFSRGSGHPQSAGTITVDHVTGGITTITINAFGIIDAD